MHMNQYLVLIQGNTKVRASAEEWIQFLGDARESGWFRGGSEIGERITVGDTGSAKPTDHIVGYLRFDTDDESGLLALLANCPAVRCGGSVELCELPKTP